MIDATQFGSITIDGALHENDIMIRLSGEVVKRKKRLSKALYGTSHTLSEAEARLLYEPDCRVVVIGSGQYGELHLSPEAESFFAAQHTCAVVLQPTPQAIRTFNKESRPKVGLFHVTC